MPYFLGLSIAAALAASASVEPPAQTVPGSLPGDETLSCPAIKTEGMARQEEIGRLTEAMQNIKVSTAPATAASVAGIGLGILGSVIGMNVPGSSTLTIATAKAARDKMRADFDRQGKPIEEQQEFALARMSRMHSLYQEKCLGTGE
jgi:hypothetical protein